MQVSTDSLPKEWPLWFQKGRSFPVSGTIFYAKAARWRNGLLEYLGNRAGESNHSVIEVRSGESGWFPDVVEKVKPPDAPAPPPLPKPEPVQVASSPAPEPVKAADAPLPPPKVGPKPAPSPETPPEPKSDKKRSHER